MTLYIDTKPELDWVEDNEPDFFSADTMFGSYCIYHYDRKDDIDVYILRLYDPNCEFGDDLMNDDEPLRPLTEAKAAAQADYERRTAERFVMVQIPSTDQIENGSMDYAEGYEDAISDLKYNIKTAIDRTNKEKL